MLYISSYKDVNLILKLTNWCSWLGVRFDSKKMLLTIFGKRWLVHHPVDHETFGVTKIKYTQIQKFLSLTDCKS